MRPPIAIAHCTSMGRDRARAGGSPDVTVIDRDDFSPQNRTNAKNAAPCAWPEEARNQCTGKCTRPFFEQDLRIGFVISPIPSFLWRIRRFHATFQFGRVGLFSSSPLHTVHVVNGVLRSDAQKCMYARALSDDLINHAGRERERERERKGISLSSLTPLVAWLT